MRFGKKIKAVFIIYLFILTECVYLYFRSLLDSCTSISITQCGFKLAVYKHPFFSIIALSTYFMFRCVRTCIKTIGNETDTNIGLLY